MPTSENRVDEAFAFAEDILNQAGVLLRQAYQEKKEVQTKSSSVDWVTQYDEAAEKLIVDAILKEFPTHSIMGEEGSRIEGSSSLKWFIDPIDGTNNFAHQFPIFCISIALYNGDEPLFGYVYDPLREEMFVARSGEGAFLESPSGKRALQVSKAQKLEESLIGTGFPYDRHSEIHNNVAELALMVRRAQGIRRPGSAALDMVYVAAGRLDGYWEFKMYAWDMAAARLIVEEAGGKVTTPEGRTVKIEEQLSLLVSNGLIHDEMLEVLEKGASLRPAFYQLAMN